MSIFSLRKIAEVCLQHRKEKDLTQKEMAEVLSMNSQTYAKIEREQYFPTVNQLEIILETIGISLDDITSEDNQHSVFVALKGNAENEDEKEIFDTLVKYILCIDKHKNISKGDYGEQ